MAKSRAQRKAEAAKRRQQGLADAGDGAGVQPDAEAQHDTQVPEAAPVVEAELAMETGAGDAEGSLEAPAPSRADVGQPAGSTASERMSRREQRRMQKEQAERARAQAERRAPREVRPEKERGAVAGFFASVVKELGRVQWPDRDTLVQASAVTLLFVAVAAAYLGLLDAVFSRLVDLLIT